MKKIKIYTITCFMIFICGAAMAQVRFFTGTFTDNGAEGIYLCNLDTLTGNITVERTFKGIDNPNYLKLSADKKFLYVVTRPSAEVEKNSGYVSAYRVDKNGEIHFINKQLSNGTDPCYVDVSPDGRFVAAANYGSGTATIFRKNNDGSLSEAEKIMNFEGSGPVKSRQSGPHAHCIRFSPFNNQVFTVDLGTDKINILNFKANQFTEVDPVNLAPGKGPRHIDFFIPEKIIYAVGELNSTITALRQNGTNWEPFQVISTLPGDYKGINYGADIHVSPDGRFLYASNRGHNSIAVFVLVNQNQQLISSGHVSVEGDWPRNFAISPDGNFMLVANQKSNNITVFKINHETGFPVFTGKQLKLPSPVCIAFF